MTEKPLLQNRVAIVTGAGSGIGRAVALAYAREGAAVVVSDTNRACGHATVRLVEESFPSASAIFIEADVARPEEQSALVATTLDRFGALHIACNNAGIGGEQNDVADLSVDGWRKVIDVNLTGVFVGMREQIPAMLAAGRGAIVNVSSILGQVGQQGAAAYVSAKHGVIGLTKVAALEYAKRGIRINAIGPAYIETPMLDPMASDVRNALVPAHPIGRFGRAGEVAELVVWLSSDRASFVTGSYYPIDGGFLAQ